MIRSLLGGGGLRALWEEVCDSDEETDKEGRVIKECHDNDSERM